MVASAEPFVQGIVSLIELLTVLELLLLIKPA